MDSNIESIDQPLEGKIILITGGASGIGLALTRQSHELGARVLIADIKTTPDFDKYAAGKDNILYVKTDVTHWPDFNNLFDECEKKWNDVPDAYGLCAGVFDPPFSNFWEDPEQEGGYKQVAINVEHPIKLTRLAIRKSLGKGKRASVCIISSIAGIMGFPSTPLYCATKHAIVGFVKSMKATEPMTGVKVTTICPGQVWTPLLTDQKQKQYSIKEEDALTADGVAKYLLDMLQKKEYPCGSVFEVSVQTQRLIPDWNVSPVEGKGTGKKLDLDAVLGPVLKALEGDKKSA